MAPEIFLLKWSFFKGHLSFRKVGVGNTSLSNIHVRCLRLLQWKSSWESYCELDLPPTETQNFRWQSEGWDWLGFPVA